MGSYGGQRNRRNSRSPRLIAGYASVTYSEELAFNARVKIMEIHNQGTLKLLAFIGQSNMKFRLEVFIDGVCVYDKVALSNNVVGVGGTGRSNLSYTDFNDLVVYVTRTEGTMSAAYLESAYDLY